MVDNAIKSRSKRKSPHDVDIGDDTATPGASSVPKKARIAYRARYNCGRWSSEELKRLFDAIKKRGCKPEVIPMLAIDVLSRSVAQVETKVEELRQAIADKHRSGSSIASPNTKAERLQVLEAATDECDCSAAAAVKSWVALIRRLQCERNLIDTSAQCLASVMEHFSKVPGNKGPSTLQFCMSVDPMSRHYRRTEICEFGRIYSYIGMCLRGQTPQKLRPLEASVLLKLLEEVKGKIYKCDTVEQQQLLRDILDDFKQGTLDTSVDHGAILRPDAVPEPDVYTVNPLCIRPDLLTLSLLPESPDCTFDDNNFTSSPDEEVIVD